MSVDSPATTKSLHLSAPADCRALVDRLLASQTLQRSTRLRELLSYLAAATFAGEFARLKEAAIGTAVYGRTEGYNTNDDNAVRMGVSQLRRKLTEYFESEGQSEGIQVDVPRGQYGLVFRTAAIASPPPSRRWMLGVAAAIALIATLTAVTWLRQAPASPDAIEAAFWQQAIGDGSGTNFVSEDIDFLATVAATHQRPRLEVYVGQNTTSSPVPATTQLSLQIATRLAAHQPARFGRVRFLPSGDLRLEAFQKQNVILVGSPRACPWLSLFESSMNFQFQHDPVRRISRFRNLEPRPGEPGTFDAAPSDGPGGNVYSAVALLPNLSGNGRVLILMGTRTEGTAAAAEAVATPRILRSILSSAGYTGSGPVPYFEALLESRVIGDSTTTPQIIAIRTHPPRNAPLTASLR